MASSSDPSLPVRPLAVTDGPSLLSLLLPAVADALSGGPALLPVPEGPPEVARRVLGTLRPDQPVETDGDDDPVALVVPTSGSTGEPKGVLLGARALKASSGAAYARLGGPGRWLLALPVTHVAGLMVLVRSVLAGTTPVVLDRSAGFDPEEFAAASVRVHATSGARRYTALVPTQLSRILQAGGAATEALAAYDAVLVGGAATPLALLDRARAAGVRAITTYGMTETCGGCVYDGEPLHGVRVQAADDGRLRVAGAVLARGYRLRPDLTAAAFSCGWFTTQDRGQVSAGGRVEVLGRVDDVAVSGGANVPLPAVDAAVASHPGVAEALAVAVDDEEWGQRVLAVVVARDRRHPPTLESVRACVTRQAPAEHAPAGLVCVDTLPVLASGKPDRRAAAALAARARPGAGRR